MSESQDAGRSAFSLLFQSPLVFTLLCPLSFAATLVFLGAHWHPNQAPLWHLLTALQPVFWLASMLVVFNDFRSHRLDWPARRSERTAVVLCTLLAWVMSSLPFMAQLITQRWALPAGMDAVLHVPHLRAKLLLLGMLSAVVTTLHTAGMLSVHVQLLAYPREPTARGGEPEAAGLDDEVLRYQRLRTRLERFLVFSAVTIGTTALSIGAFRDLLTQFLPSEVFEPSRVVSYGVYYTGLLASVYLPTRKTLTDVGESLTARFVRPSPAGALRAGAPAREPVLPGARRGRLNGSGVLAWAARPATKRWPTGRPSRRSPTVAALRFKTERLLSLPRFSGSPALDVKHRFRRRVAPDGAAGRSWPGRTSGA